jgi:PAS domain S-box-containing protein
MNTIKQNFSFLFYALAITYLIFTSSLALCAAETDNVLYLSDNDMRNKPSALMTYYTDETNSLSIQEISSDDYTSKLKPLNGEPSLGFSSSIIWSRILIRNDTELSKWYLRFLYLGTDQLTIYTPNIEGGYDSQTRSFHEDFSKRIIEDRLISVHLPVSIGTQKSIYLRFKTNSTISLRAKILSEKEWIHTRVSEAFYHALLYGALILAIIVSLIFAYISRSIQYVYVLTVCFGFILSNGLYDGYIQTLFGVYTGLSIFFPLGVFGLSCAMVALVSYQRDTAPELKQKKLFTYSYYLVCSYWLGLLIASAIFSSNTYLFIFTVLGCMGSTAYALFSAWSSYLSGNRKSRYLVIGLSFLLLGLVVHCGRLLGLFDYVLVGFDGFRLGSTVLVLTMIVSMQDDIRELQHNAEKSTVKFKMLFENMVDAIYLVSIKGRIVDANTAAQVIETRARNELVGENFVSESVLASDPVNQAKLLQAIQNAREGSFTQVELVLSGKGIQPRYINASIALYKEEDAQGLHVLINCQDVSESKQQQLNINCIASAVSKHTGGAFFDELALSLAEISQRDYIVIGAYADNAHDKIKSIAFCADGQITDNFTFEIKDTPSEKVLRGDICIYRNNVHTLFPNDLFLTENNIRSYMAKALVDSKGQAIGIIVIMDSSPLENESLEAMVNIFSSRAVAELERLNNDQNLYEIQQKLALHVENTPLGVLQLNIHSDIVEWNDSAYRIFGYGKHEVLGISASNTIFLGMSDIELGRLLSNKEKTIWHHLDKSGRQIICEWFITPLISDNEELGYAALVVDITNERQMLSALQRKQIEQSEILNSMTDAVITIDEEGVILSLNSATEQLFHYAKNELLGNNIKLLMEDSLALQHDDYLKNHVNQSDATIMGAGRQVEGKQKNGEFFPIQVTISELSKSIEGKRRFIGSCHDLTHVKLQERQIRQLGKMEAIGKLTGGVAHDFNNLLGIITGYTDLLSNLLYGEEKEQKYLKEIDRALSRGAQLTKKLLYLSKKRPMETRIVNLNTIVRDMEHVLSCTMTPMIDILFDIDKRMNLVSIDPHFLEDSVLNLCINAMHAMDNHGTLSIKTEVSVNVDSSMASQHGVKEGLYSLLTVSDVGCGMTEAVQKKIFDPFYSNKGDMGTGLGLSQVNSFIQQSKGFIQVESDLGKGSTFSLFFPQNISLNSESVSSIANVETREVLAMLGKETILLVDDEEMLLNAAAECLTQNGYQVISTTSPIEALEILKNQDISVLVSDVIMPNMDGYELADQAKEIKPELKILLVSGFTNRTDEQKAHALYKSVLNKPYKLKTLLERVRNTLDQ